MKKIIYILDDGKRAFTYERIAGFIEAIKNADEEINLYIFRSDHKCCRGLREACRFNR